MKPILFNTAMVQAIQDGRKTMTRRIIKAPVLSTNRTPDKITHEGDEFTFTWTGPDVIGGFTIKPPYQPGEILWVKETWRMGAWDHFRQSIAIDYKADGFIRREWIRIADVKLFNKYVEQSAKQARKRGFETTEDGRFEWEPGQSPCRWRPSIHMPKAAARIWLRVTDIQVERLQEITNEGAFAEGCDGRGLGPSSGCDGSLSTREYDWSIEKFETVWDSTVSKKDLGRYGWDANPFVWVISFERCENPQEES